MPFLKRRRFVSVIGRKSSVPDGLWMKCPGCEKTVSSTEVEQNFMVCPQCDHHNRITARQRLGYLLDPDSFQETHDSVQTSDPIHFVIPEQSYSYPERAKKARAKTDVTESIITGFGEIEKTRAVIGAMDFGFLGGSMGSAFGEKFCRTADDAIANRIPFVVFTSSGGARMDEGILGLMQMAKTSDGVRAMNEAGIPYISVLTHPTTGGVYASFASLGDILIAEPGAQIGFAGPRLIEGALKVKLPEGFQSAESQFNNGFVDCIVNRTEMRSVLGRLLKYLTPQ
ncbi:MAG: acetyl-CoA carboxylase, carboxyltransferase subunit beta [Candidatus Hydrogenedentes bacterium]|nr:acetyl-CoA carboxylase, carboxyltransferase subunit beta [Candidatus Hydrogenedentota bacterium]